MMAKIYEADQKKLSLLLVEDDESHVAIIRRALEKARVKSSLKWVPDGEKAIEYLEKQTPDHGDDRPDVVILDLNLPRKSGLDVLAEIRSNPALEMIPVVALSTSEAEDDRRRSYRLGVNSYLVKPMNHECFMRLIDDLTFYWGRWNAFAPLPIST